MEVRGNARRVGGTTRSEGDAERIAEDVRYDR